MDPAKIKKHLQDENAYLEAVSSIATAELKQRADMLPAQTKDILEDWPNSFDRWKATNNKLLSKMEDIEKNLNAELEVLYVMRAAIGGYDGVSASYWKNVLDEDIKNLVTLLPS